MSIQPYSQRQTDSDIEFRHPFTNQSLFYDSQKLAKYCREYSGLFDDAQHTSLIYFRFSPQVLALILNWIDEGPKTIPASKLDDFLEIGKKWKFIKMVDDCQTMIFENFDFYLKEMGYVRLFQLIKKYFPDFSDGSQAQIYFNKIRVDRYDTKEVPTLTYEELKQLSKLVGAYYFLLEAWVVESKNQKYLIKKWNIDVSWRNWFLGEIGERQINVIRRLKNFEILETTFLRVHEKYRDLKRNFEKRKFEENKNVETKKRKFSFPSTIP